MTKDRFQSLLINQGLHHSIADYIDESWYEIFENLLPELKEVFSKLHEETLETDIGQVHRKRNTKVIYPTDTLILRAFKLCKLTNLKCIWMLQDPYHDGSAVGLCLDNTIGRKVSPSLKNVLNELLEDDVELDNTEGKKTLLEHLPSQGVLLLNTALTVEKGKPDSHLEIWKPFTRKLLELLGKQEQLIWCLWGAKALAYRDIIEKQQNIDKIGVDKTETEFILYPIRSKQRFIISSHPSPLGANKPMQGYPAFIGSKPFSRVNKYLKEWDKIEIKW